MTCACGKGASLEECCLPYIRGDKVAETAEVLMRTRYTAYTLSNVGYLLETHHPSSVNDVDPKSMAVWAKKSQWHGLEIVSTDRGGVGDDEGVVEFIARYTQDGTGFTHHERSRFEKVSGRWYFKSGSMVVPTVRNENKVGRNDPCPCGSGKKYKKCHGA